MATVAVCIMYLMPYINNGERGIVDEKPGKGQALLLSNRKAVRPVLHCCQAARPLQEVPQMDFPQQALQTKANPNRVDPGEGRKDTAK